MTELSFLIELLLNHELTKPTKDLVASRIKDVEARLQPVPQRDYHPAPAHTFTVPSVEPVAVIAHTQAAAAALEHRSKMIADAVAGKAPHKNYDRKN